MLSTLRLELETLESRDEVEGAELSDKMNCSIIKAKPNEEESRQLGERRSALTSYFFFPLFRFRTQVPRTGVLRSVPFALARQSRKRE